MPKVSAVIVAGGSSERMGGADKLFLEFGGKAVVERSIAAFQNNALVAEIVVASAAANIEKIQQICAPYDKLKAVVSGGADRNASVQNAIKACSPDAEYYAIHDAARPFVSDELISNTIRAAFDYGAAAPCLPLSDTVKVIDGHSTIVSTPDRSSLVSVATPQVFEAMLYRSAAKGQSGTYDDCQLLETVGRKIKVVEGEASNIKITTPADIKRAQAMFEKYIMRIGHGYDVHRLVEGRALVLGGVDIEHDTGLLGHSDADVLSHAVIDALLGAAALGDIGALFPDSDAKYKDICSLELVKEVAREISKRGLEICNVDVTVVCEAPKLRPHIDAMRQNLAQALEIVIDAINIKATTEEGLGFTGTKHGIAAHAVALVRACN